MRLMTYRTPQSVECVQASERALPLPTSISRFLKREIQAFHCSLQANSWLIPNLPMLILQEMEPKLKVPRHGHVAFGLEGAPPPQLCGNPTTTTTTPSIPTTSTSAAAEALDFYPCLLLFVNLHYFLFLL